MNAWVACVFVSCLQTFKLRPRFPKGGPVAMVRGAALYGGFTYVISGGLNRPRQEFQYKEEALEF